MTEATGKVPHMSFGPTELIIVLLIVLLLFGGAKLPKLARSLGEASKEFKKGVEDKDKEETKDDGKTASS
jgi:sec-independent protein translocase protein TatA